MFEADDVTVISSSETRQKKILISERIITGIPPVINPIMLEKHNWVCVGIEDELEGEAASKFARACANANFVNGWSLEIPWDSKQENVSSHYLSFSEKSIKNLTKGEYIGSCYIIVEDLSRFVITSDGDLYWMLAGPRRFVEEVIGHSIEVQLNIFEKSVATYNGRESSAGKILMVVQDISKRSNQ